MAGHSSGRLNRQHTLSRDSASQPARHRPLRAEVQNSGERGLSTHGLTGLQQRFFAHAMHYRTNG